MIFTPVYCSSEPPPASGPVRSKITPILIFFSCASAGAAKPAIRSRADAARSATNSLTDGPAAWRTDIDPSQEDCVTCLFLEASWAPITLIARSDVKRVGNQLACEQGVY